LPNIVERIQNSGDQQPDKSGSGTASIVIGGYPVGFPGDTAVSLAALHSLAKGNVRIADDMPRTAKMVMHLMMHLILCGRSAEQCKHGVTDSSPMPHTIRGFY
jgi:hypothetical protein